MMGRLGAQEDLFYRFRIEDHVSQDHLLRRIDRLLDCDAIRAELAALYSHTGHPSVDPELMLRMLLIGYLYGIRSERRLVEEVHLNLAYRWFCKLGLEGRVPDRSTFSKNRHGRFAEGDVLRRLFESVVEKCIGFGIVGGTDAAIDGSTIEADANRDRKDAPDAIQKIWSQKDQVERPVADYLEKLADTDCTVQSGPKKPPKYISETDPEAAWSLKDGPGRFSYETNYLVDTDHGIIVDVEATPARLSQEIVAAKAMLERSRSRHDFRPDRVAADGSYGTGPFLAWFLKREVTPHVPVLTASIRPKASTTSAISSMTPIATATPASKATRCRCDGSSGQTGSKAISPGRKPAARVRSRMPAPTRRSEPSHATWTKKHDRPSARCATRLLTTRADDDERKSRCCLPT